MRVLIAEDDASTRQLLATYLNKWGYAAIPTNNGEDALKVLESPEAPHIAILDWMMPGANGIDICRKIRQKEKEKLIHIIILTARESKEDVLKGFDAGADDFITKPFNKDELRARIKVGERIVVLQSALSNRVKELEKAVSHIKTLQGILPICMHCHKIRDDQEIWQRLEKYITDRTDAMLSHSLCPDCMTKYYTD